MGYGGGVYVNDPNLGNVESIGNFIRPGLALELDVGARLARRFIPYLALELGLAGAGHRFDNTQTNAGSSFLGVGVRFLAGDVDNVAFASDLSFGMRQLGVSNGGGSWSASGIELLRLGVGAEIRLASHFALSPMITLSGGSFTDTSGNVAYAPNQPDLATGPAFVNGASIPGAYRTTYYSIVVGCGAHFDLFGR
jgi:hypothetical protein